MHKNRLLSIGFVALLMLNVIMLAAPLAPVTAKPSGTYGSIWVEPDYVNGSLVGYGNTFVVEVKINISDTSSTPPGIVAFAYYFTWNDTLLELISRNTYVPAWEYGSSVVADALLDIDPQAAVDDTHSYSVTALSTPTPFTGVMTLADYTLKVVYQPTYPEPDMSDALDVEDKGFIFGDEEEYPMDEYDGTYEIFSGAPPTPMLEVKDPRDLDHEIERCNFPLGEKFNVTICITDLHWGKYFRAWEAKVEFDTTLLNITGFYNGTFMELFGMVFYVNVTYEELGYVIVGATYLADPSPEPGTTPPCAPSYGPAQGVLLYIEFLVTNTSIAPVMYQCEIGLFNTTLVDKDDNPIDHGISSNLMYYACYETLGWYLDCTTDDYRKKCDPKYIGVGPNATADAYEPQDLVILYAYLEYNQEPEAYKMVTFEIHGPANPVYNITIIRPAWTNESGIATINFTIPGSGIPDWYTMVAGKWWCYQAAQVKIYTKVTDWLFFEVGWIVELLDVTVEPQQVKKGEVIDITISFKNIMCIPKNVVFTVTVLDELLDPIQKDIYGWEVAEATMGEVEEFEPGLFAANPIPFEGSIVLNSTIEDWAHVGLATVYVNAFTDIPSNCGCPYCPEITTTFWIVATADP